MEPDDDLLDFGEDPNWNEEEIDADDEDEWYGAEDEELEDEAANEIEGGVGFR